MASLAGLPPDVARVLQEAARRAERHAVLDSAMTQMQRLLNIPVVPEMLPWGSAMSQSKAYFFRTWISTTAIILSVNVCWWSGMCWHYTILTLYIRHMHVSMIHNVIRIWIQILLVEMCNIFYLVWQLCQGCALKQQQHPQQSKRCHPRLRLQDWHAPHTHTYTPTTRNI